MDGVSVAASIVGIATAGIQISIKVVTLAGQINTASERISSIGNDVSLTSSILHQLGDLMSQKTTNNDMTIFSKEGLQTTKSSADICQRIFQEVENETAKASELLRGRKQRIGEKVKLSTLEKAKWPFLQPRLEVLRTDLREAKGTLMLMLQIASLALSKRVADLNTSASFRVTEQQDVIRSILILQQQQQDQKSSPNPNINAMSVQDQGKSELGASRDVEMTDPLVPTAVSGSQPRAAEAAKREDANFQLLADLTERPTSEARRPNQVIDRGQSGRKNAQHLKAEISSESREESSHENSGTPPSSKANRTGQICRTSLPEGHHSHIYDRASSPVSSGQSCAAELRMYSIDPKIKAGVDEVRVVWSWSDLPIPEDWIRERLARDQVDGRNAVFDTMLSLDVFERRLVAAMVELMEPAYVASKRLYSGNPRARAAILLLNRTEQDLQHGSLVVKAVPSFQLIVQHDTEYPKASAKAAANGEGERERGDDLWEGRSHFDRFRRGRNALEVPPNDYRTPHAVEIPHLQGRAMPTNFYEFQRSPVIQDNKQPFFKRSRGGRKRSKGGDRSRSKSRVLKKEIATSVEGESDATEDEGDEAAEAISQAEDAGEMTAVNELLKQYTTLFDEAA